MRPGRLSLTQTSGSRTTKPISLRKNIPSQEKAGRTSKGLGSWKGDVGLKNILNEDESSEVGNERSPGALWGVKIHGALNATAGEEAIPTKLSLGARFTQHYSRRQR